MIEKKPVQIAVYGSLRLNEYNYEAFKRIFGKDFNYIRTTSILGYNLYDLGSYPGLKPAANDTDRVIVDIMECSEECFNNIQRMEHGAGYITVKVTEEGTDNKFPAYVYEYPCDNLVVSGDWSKYLKQEEIVL